MVSAPYKKLDRLIPPFREKVESFLKLVRDSGLKIIITETWRSPERQQDLYAQGRTKTGQIVTWTLFSKHMIGEAIDVAFLIPFDKITYNGDWEKLGALGELSGLRWGGRWKPSDKPHFEYITPVSMEIPHLEPWKMDVKMFIESLVNTDNQLVRDVNQLLTDDNTYNVMVAIFNSSTTYKKLWQDFLKNRHP